MSGQRVKRGRDNTVVRGWDKEDKGGKQEKGTIIRGGREDSCSRQRRH